MKLLVVKDLMTHYLTANGNVRAVDGVNLEIHKGQMVGIIGESACGKTTFGMSLIRLVQEPGKIVAGKILLDNKDILLMNEADFRTKIAWKQISMVFQGAMNALNPLHRIRDQIIEAVILHENISKEAAVESVNNLLEKTGIDKSRSKSYPFEFSGGMKQRVAISMALACEPKVVILDEPTTGLDVIVAWNILKLLKNLQKKMKLSFILITHDMSIVAQTCDLVYTMYAGKFIEHSDIKSLFQSPIHPYTQALIKAVPTTKSGKGKRFGIKGNPPSLINPSNGCRFAPRCLYAKDVCRREEPELREVEKGRFVACHFADQIYRKMG